MSIMNKRSIVLTGLLAVMLLVGFIILPAVAETPYTVTAALSTTTGAGAWTNSKDYVVLKLTSVEVFAALDATTTVTVHRVRSGRTNSVGSIVLADNAGIYRETNVTYLFKGDVLAFQNVASTGGTVEVTGVLYP